MIEIDRQGMKLAGRPLRFGDYLEKYADPDEEYQTPQMDVRLCGQQMIGSLLLKDGVLQAVTMTVPGRAKSWGDWSWEVEYEKEESLRQLMLSAFGSEEAHFSWGTIVNLKPGQNTFAGLYVTPAAAPRWLRALRALAPRRRSKGELKR